MLRKNSGITLITIVFMVIIILILTSIFIATSLNALNEAKNSEIQSEMHALAEAITIRYTSYVKNDKKISLPGKTPTWADANSCTRDIFEKMGITDEEQQNKISGDMAAHYDEYVKIITKKEAATLGVDPFSDENKYVVDYYTSRVYGPMD